MHAFISLPGTLWDWNNGIILSTFILEGKVITNHVIIRSIQGITEFIVGRSLKMVSQPNIKFNFNKVSKPQMNRIYKKSLCLGSSCFWWPYWWWSVSISLSSLGLWVNKRALGMGNILRNTLCVHVCVCEERELKKNHFSYSIILTHSTY